MKKAQIHMFESTMVLLFFFVFVGIGMVFYFNATKEKIGKDVIRLQSLDAIKVALVALNAPEFVHTSGDVKDSTSFDLQKLKGFEALMYMDTDYPYTQYFNLFGYSTIWVEEVYPGSGIPIILYNRTRERWTHSEKFSMPVGLRDVIEGKTKLGVLTVEVWQ
jgi:hypothetical protein